MSRHPNARALYSAQDVGDKLLPVLVGGDILTYSYLREFHRAYGVTRCIVLASHDIKVISSSRFADYRIRQGIHDPENLYGELAAIAAAEPDKTLLLLGSDDVHARLFSQAKDRLEAEGYIVPYIDFDLLDDITHKDRFHEICASLGIPYPSTYYVDCSFAGVDPDPCSFTYPLIVKPANSALFQEAHIAHKKKIYEVENAPELADILHSVRVSDYDDRLIIQDFIPGGDEAIHTLTLFADRNGVTRVGAGGTVCVQDHDPTALGNPLCILGEQVDEIYTAGARFLQEVGYHGFANFDIKYDKRDGSYRFLEVNARCGRNSYYMSLAGINFVTLFVEDFILGNELPRRYANDPFLFCCVPRLVLERSMQDGPLKNKTLELYTATEHRYPLAYRPDTLRHNLWAEAMYVNQIPKFKRFYWDTGGKQCAV